MLRNYLNSLGLSLNTYYPIDEIQGVLSEFSQRMSKPAFAMFLAQSAFETSGYSKFIENLYYTSAQRIAQVWPSRFYIGTPKQGKKNASNYVRNPIRLANVVYANRYGNGDEASGDGYKYRGRGAFHLTFKNNYKDCSLDCYNDLRFLENPDLVADCFYGFESAYWFFHKNGIDNLPFNSEFLEKATRIINGSVATVGQRRPYYNKALQVLGI